MATVNIKCLNGCGNFVPHRYVRKNIRQQHWYLKGKDMGLVEPMTEFMGLIYKCEKCGQERMFGNEPKKGDRGGGDGYE
jgi:hypothetical protein